jgi:hypothetical protein
MGGANEISRKIRRDSRRTVSLILSVLTVGMGEPTQRLRSGIIELTTEPNYLCSVTYAQIGGKPANRFLFNSGREVNP